MVRDYHHSLRNDPEERSSHLFRGESLKSRLPLQYLYKYNIRVTSAKQAKRNTRYQFNEYTLKKTKLFGKQYVGLTPLCVHTHAKRGKSHVIYFIISVFFPFHIVLAVDLSLKQTALLLLNYSHNMLPLHHFLINRHDWTILVIFSQAHVKAPWWWILCGPNMSQHF